MQKTLKKTLSNGLRVILLENHAAPVVSWNLWSNVGSVNETDKEAGLCHLIEHMIFKGTSRRPVGQIAKEVEASGGDMNAYTSFDETVFYINMSSRNLDVGLDILADAATDPTFDQEELTREKEVVVEEISRGEDNPSQMVSQDLFGKAFSVHPYHRPIAGSRETVREVSREYLLAFYRKWYVGSNLIFIGVGDFNSEEIFSRIETLFAGIPFGLAPVQSLPVEPEQVAQRVVTRAMAVEGRYLDLCFPIPNLMHPDIAALDVLSHILGGGGSSRLEQSLAEKKQLVSSISTYPYTPRHPGLFVIGTVLRERALKETIEAIWEEINLLKAELPSAMEFARARENIRSSRIYERQTVEAMARKLGYFEGIANDLNFEEDYYKNLALVTPEDIQKMVQKYLVPEKITLSFCHPKTESWPVEKIEGWLHSGTHPKPKLLKKSDSTKSKNTSSSVENNIFRFRLPSGVKVLIRENHNLPLVSIRSASLGGLRRENAKNNGINHLIASLVSKGTSHRTAREIAEQTENLSGHIDAYAGRNLIGVGGTFLSEKTTEGLELFFDLLMHPSFPEDELSKEKKHTYTSIRNSEDSLSYVATKKFLAELYPKHPYGLPMIGTTSSVKSLTRDDLLQYYSKIVRPDNLVLTIVGDVSGKEIQERLKAKLAGWKGFEYKSKKAKKESSSLSTPKAPQKPIEVMTTKKKNQAHIVYGFLGTTLSNNDRYALEVMNSIMSGQGGRLFMELRDKKGLAYTVSCSTHEGIEPGYVLVYMGTDPIKLSTSIEGIKVELQKIRESLVSKEELDRAKRFIIGNHEIDLQKNNSVAAVLTYNEIYGIGYQELFDFSKKIERVTREDVLRVAKKYLRPEASVLSIVKP